MIFLILSLLALTADPALAHHAFSAEFDANAPVRLRGKVTKVELINPHAWIHIRVKEKGKPAQDWSFEGGSPNVLLRAGLNRNTLKIGEEVVVRGYQSKDRNCKPACIANGREILFPDGRKVFFGTSGGDMPRDGADPAYPLGKSDPATKNGDAKP